MINRFDDIFRKNSEKRCYATIRGGIPRLRGNENEREALIINLGFICTLRQGYKGMEAIRTSVFTVGVGELEYVIYLTYHGASPRGF